MTDTRFHDQHLWVGGPIRNHSTDTDHRHPADQIDNLDALIDQRAADLDTDWVQVTGAPENPRPNTIYFEVE